MTCYHGHKIKEYRDDDYEYMQGGYGYYGEDPDGFCKPRIGAWDNDEFVAPSNPNNLICQSCKKPVNGIDRALYTCSETCDFDFCPNCATCKGDELAAKHIMHISYVKPQNVKSICGSFKCNRCFRSINDYEAKCGFMRCNKCEINVCRQCITRPIMQ